LANPLRYTDPSGRFVNNIVLNPDTYINAALVFNPELAIGYGLYMAVTGYDPIHNRQLSDGERWLNGVWRLTSAISAARATVQPSVSTRLTRSCLPNTVNFALRCIVRALSSVGARHPIPKSPGSPLSTTSS
jgi:Pre-toxin TG